MAHSSSQAGRLLAVTALGTHRAGLALELVQEMTQRGCGVLDSRISPLGASLCANFLVGGNWSALGRLETALPGIGERLGLKIHFQRTDMPGTEPKLRPYAVDVVAPQRADLLEQLLDFFHHQDVLVNEAVTVNYASGQTGAAMCNLHLTVNVPIDQHPQALRDAFLDLCDDLHADGMLDPIKS